MCSITANDKQQPIYIYDIKSGGGRPIPKNSSTESLERTGCYLKLY